MSRLVLKDATGPLEIRAGAKSTWGACGLSRKWPDCDGSHILAKDELPGKVCRYNPCGTRKIVEG